MHNNNNDTLILALPSKGQLSDDSTNFLGRAGLSVYKPNTRQYTASIPSLPNLQVVFQRPTDIFGKVSEGTVDIGITGLDIVAEYTEDADDVHVIEKLGFGKCELLMAVPESWIDVTSIADLADLTIRNQEMGKQLRVATKYGNLTKEFLYRQGISHFLLVHADGALEAAPRMGYADMICDLSETGTTLRENHLRPLDGGVIVESEAVLIGNVQTLSRSPQKLESLREMIELIEAHKRSRQYVAIRANIKGESLEDVQQRILANPELCGTKGPGVVPVASAPGTNGKWFETNLLIGSNLIHKTMQHLRDLGGTDIIVTRPDYVFVEKSHTYERFEDTIRQLQKIN